MSKQAVFCAAIVAACLCGPTIHAQQPEPIKRTVLQTGNFPGDKMTTLLVLVEVVPNASNPFAVMPSVAGALSGQM